MIQFASHLVNSSLLLFDTATQQSMGIPVVDADGFQLVISKKSLREQSRYIESQLKQADCMTEREAFEVQDLFALDTNDR